jgi:hypothetical protein
LNICRKIGKPQIPPQKCSTHSSKEVQGNA